MIKHHKGGQRALYLHPARFQVVACGRRWGKTEFAIKGIQKSLWAGADAWWVSPTYKMSSMIWRDFKRRFKGYYKSANGSERIMEFSNGATLTVWTGTNFETMRGGAPDIIAVDEAAMITKGQMMWDEVLRPTLLDSRGKALFLSTPKGRNWFYKFALKGMDKSQRDWMFWSFPTSANPYIDSREVEIARLDTPERAFRQEYLAEFMDDAGGVFRGVIEVSTLDERKPYAGGRFVFGIDWGRFNDYTVISIIDKNTAEQVYMERFTDIDFKIQYGRIEKLIEQWRPEEILVEVNSIGQAGFEHFRDMGHPVRAFTTTHQSKIPLIDDLALAIEKGHIALLNDRVQVHELQAYEIERTKSQRMTYNAPSGGNDDTVIALALAWNAASSANSFIYDYVPQSIADYRG